MPSLGVRSPCMEALLLKHSNICVLLWHFVLALKPRAFINQNGTDVMIMFFHFGLCLPVLSLKGDKLLSFTDTQPYLPKCLAWQQATVSFVADGTNVPFACIS